jgi:N-acetylglucosamine-6-phosphate deacetylase
MRHALVNARVLLDEGFVTDRAVLIDDGRIADVLAPGKTPDAGFLRQDLGGAMLLPGFIDTQVNGGGGVLFNDAPSVESILAIGRAHRRFGTTSFLPTLISDDLAAVAKAITATRDAIDAGIPGVIGLHVEGPFISPARRGAHDLAKIRDIDPADVDLLASLDNGHLLVTLAPERTTAATIARLAAAGVIVSAGHTNASFAVINDALAHGVTGFTHLFNAMSPLTNREPGVVGAALFHADSWCGIIVDGVHVDPVVLQIALRAKRHDRFMLVTDAMPNVGSDQDFFLLQGRRISVRDGRCVDEEGTLSGSALDMASAVRNAVDLLGLPLDEAVRMASASPARFLGLDKEVGRIVPGLRANFVVADDDLAIIDTWIDGVSANR